MAKFAKCGYGSQGQGMGPFNHGYTYIVNDNVRTGDVIQVAATNRWSKKKFGTTAQIKDQRLYSENTLKGQLAKQEVESLTGKEATRAYSGPELGISRKGLTQQQYREQVRGGNLNEYIEKNPEAQLTKNAQKTFDEYSQQFMNKGEQE